MYNTGVEVTGRMNELKELDVVVAVKSRVDVNSKLHLLRVTDVGA